MEIECKFLLNQKNLGAPVSFSVSCVPNHSLYVQTKKRSVIELFTGERPSSRPVGRYPVGRKQPIRVARTRDWMRLESAGIAVS